jgi:hypothetical protein
MAMHREYYKGEGGGFPQVQAVMSFVSLRLPVAHPCTKGASTMHGATCLIYVSACK